MLVNAVILGKIQIDEKACKLDKIECIGPKTYLAAFGVGSSTLGIILLASGLTYCVSLSNVIPQAFG